jgi:Ca2+-binding EF-hand superfamily protein
MDRQEIFVVADSNMDGVLQFDELKLALRSSGVIVKDSELESLRSKCPMGFSQFEHLLDTYQEQGAIFSETNDLTLLKDLKLAFDRLDSKHKGSLSVEELRALLTTIGEPVSVADFDQVFVHSVRAKRDASKTLTHGLTFEQFYKFITAKPVPVTQKK